MAAASRRSTPVPALSWVTYKADPFNWRSAYFASDLSKLCAVAYDDGNIALSESGTSWLTKTLPSQENWADVCRSVQLGLFCAVGSSVSAGNVATSADGEDWAIGTVVDFAWFLLGVCSAPDLSQICTVGYRTGGHGVVAVFDGEVWIQGTISDGTWTSVCRAQWLGLYIAVSDEGKVATSPDGLTWTDRTAASANAWVSVFCSESRQIVVALGGTGNSSDLMTSTTGTSWVTRNPPVSGYWGDGCWFEDLGLFCCVGMNLSSTVGQVMTSTLGTQWVAQPQIPGQQWNAVCAAPPLLKFCALNGNDISDCVLLGGYTVAGFAIDHSDQPR